ncbi:CD209 antigen-like protein C [Tachysurus vachellii]|uniref:CD209 antigen-like protein C n=1 Tax=Tachysurus vachellii TaxID=175792 RepID=UPI00296AE8AC|nr:CD209 antigen-like protein C [Tachysurus vachellii]
MELLSKDATTLYGEHIERVVEIYESAEAVRDHDPKTDLKNFNTKTQHTGTHTSPEIPDIIREQKCTQDLENINRSQSQTQLLGEDKKVSRVYTLTAMCVLLLLCVLLLTSITVLGIKNNILRTENNQLQTSYTNLTLERQHLQKEKDGLQRKLSDIETYTKQGWSYFNSSFYYISTEKENWTKSRQECRNRGADLVIIDNKEEAFIPKWLLNSKTAWIGLSDREKVGVWKWVDGTTLKTGHWNKGEPNHGKIDEDCVEILGSSKSWNDRSCSDRLLFICEMNAFNL